MYNQKIKNVELLNTEELQLILLGIRTKFNLSQPDLAYKIGLSKDTILRIENKQKIPKESTIITILQFINQNNLDIHKLVLLGKNNTDGYSKNTKIPKLNLFPSNELAELIGIILGDGEIMEDGTIRIAFDPKKDKNFLYRRIFLLVRNLLGSKISFESYKRIAFYNIAFVRYLKEDCNLNSGSKFRNNWGVPEWCFNDKEYLKCILRGLFDTDGYFGYYNGSVEIMYGRFSDRCIKLIRSIGYALTILGFERTITQSNDGRFKVRLTNKKEVIRFFSVIGTSNLKHIVRFLLWRIAGYEAKIEKEGLTELIDMTNRLIEFKVESINLPYLWKTENNIICKSFIENDIYFIKTHITKTKAI